MLGGALSGGDFAHPEKVATTDANANATTAAVRAKFSGRGVMLGNFAADQLDLLRPRIGFRDCPQYKLVETLRNIFPQARDDVVRRAVNGAFEVGLRAA